MENKKNVGKQKEKINADLKEYLDHLLEYENQEDNNIKKDEKETIKINKTEYINNNDKINQNYPKFYNKSNNKHFMDPIKIESTKDIKKMREHKKTKEPREPGESKHKESKYGKSKHRESKTGKSKHRESKTGNPGTPFDKDISKGMNILSMKRKRLENKVKKEYSEKIENLKAKKKLIDEEIKKIKDNEKIELNKIKKKMDEKENDFISEMNEEISIKSIILNAKDKKKGNK